MNETFTDWALVSLSPLRGTWLWLASIAVVVAAALVVVSYRRARRPWALIVLRSLAALLVLGFLLEPAVQLRVVRRVRSRLAVVVDGSRSMTLAGSQGQSRQAGVQALLKNSQAELAALGETHILEWYDLDGPITPADVNLPAEGERTDLLNGLEAAKGSGAGRPLAGLVLLSDGADNAGLEAKGKRGELSDTAQERLAKLEVPVNSVDITGGEAFADVAVAEVIADEFAFVHNTLEVEALLEVRGFADMTVPVTLKREGEVIATQEVPTSPSKTASALFKIKPDRIGEFVYTVSVPPFAGEAVLENNQRSFAVQVIRDKIRVLQVAGRPSWDERFLRQHLKENPNVDLISFFILRTPSDDTSVAEQELSLIPFPTDKIFRTELHTFDVVILQDFDYRPYRMDMYLKSIRGAVEGGLGFVMIGGGQSFADGGYFQTDIEAIVPLSLADAGLVDRPVQFELSEAGRRHPVTDLLRGTGDNLALWRKLGGWVSFNRTGGLAEGATALLVEPTARDRQGQPMPLIAVKEVGQGRSMAIATDSMWRWRFSSSKDGGISERAYHRFWSNALRWLVRDPEHSRVRVLPEKRRLEVGESTGVEVQVLGADYQPISNARVELSLSQAAGSELRVDELVTGDGGRARQAYSELQAGAYRLTARARDGDKNLGDANAVLVVESRSPELALGAPRPDLLERLSRATNGKVLESSPELWRDLALLDPEVVEADKRRNVELWDNAWALVAAALLLAAEWAVRRRRGYL